MKRSAFFVGCLTVAAAAACARDVRASEAKYAVEHTDAEWRALLGSDRYAILREGGTEMPFSSPLNNETRAGIYNCAGCNLALFSSKTKYDAGEGWPSFWDVLPNAVDHQADYQLVDERTEIHCRQCGGHLGHVFDDGPPPTHLRYCIDGLALRFYPTKV
jgi:peptide-methionine (R)-S-oxide reductase